MQIYRRLGLVAVQQTVGLHEAASTLELLASHCHSAIAGGGHGVIELREMYINRLSCLPNMLQQRLAGSAVPQYARRHPRHCAPYAAVYAVPQYTAARYCVGLNRPMQQSKIFRNFFFTLYFRKKHYSTAIHADDIDL